MLGPRSTKISRVRKIHGRRTFRRGRPLLWKMECQAHFSLEKGQGEEQPTQAKAKQKDGACTQSRVLIYDFDAAEPSRFGAKMYQGSDRPTWQQPVYPERASPPQSQTGWFPLQDAEQQQHTAQQSQSEWLPGATSPSHDRRVYAASSPVYSSAPAPSPPYIWTSEAHSHSPPARTVQFISSPTYPRPLILSEPGLYDREDQQPKPQTVLRHNKQIAIGRWNSEEHQWFLKGLEMFQGPAWGEIARLIGTRTSTQVRTHAQKFFTKMARLNQTMPYFEVQIQKERARLVAQGANVTPTAQSTSNAPLPATLSPRKRLASTSNSPRQSLRRFKEEAAKSPTYGIAVQARRYPQDAPDMKPRVYTSGFSSSSSPSSGPVMTKEWPQQQWVADDARQWPLASPTSTAASLQLTQLQLADVGQPTTPNSRRRVAAVHEQAALP